jgi:hypothetical protein
MEANPYYAKIPSIFVICSPFQTLCTVSTIMNLKIDDYKIIVIYSARYNQIRTVLNEFNLSYEIRRVGRYSWKMRCNRILSLFHRNNKYKRLFVGDYRNKTLLSYGLNLVSDDSYVVYLDDGNASISLFRDSIDINQIYNKSKFQKAISRRRNIIMMKYFYSIYTGINNTRYNIVFNDLSVLGNQKVSGKERVVFIGTNSDMYCSFLSINISDYYNILRNQIEKIRNNYPQTSILYIPHGKDTSEIVKKICEDNEIEYERQNVPVEMMFRTKFIVPIAIYGFTSSALFNLKKMFPECKVNNILIIPQIQSKNFNVYVSISDYYSQNGIQQINITLSD